jgi:predicted transcriptional regulator
VKFTKKHKLVYEFIRDDPDQTIVVIHAKVGMKTSSTHNYISHLRQVGLVATSGKVSKRGYMRYRVTELDYEDVIKSYQPEEKEKITNYVVQSNLPDPIFKAVKTYELSDSEWKFIKENPELSRSELVKKLGIPRTILLAAICRRKERERGGKS